METYRIDQPRPRPKSRTMQDTSTVGEVVVHNGCTANLAIPCYYQEVRPPLHAHPHDRMRHDMLGWPTPDHPDHVCQEWDFDRRHCRRTPHLKCCPPKCEHMVDMGRLIPIDLRDEGYDRFTVVLAGDTEGVEASASLDTEDPWVVRVTFSAEVAGLLDPSSEPLRLYYSVRADREGASDIVALGRLTVLPAPIETS